MRTTLLKRRLHYFWMTPASCLKLSNSVKIVNSTSDSTRTIVASQKCEMCRQVGRWLTQLTPLSGSQIHSCLKTLSWNQDGRKLFRTHAWQKGHTVCHVDTTPCKTNAQSIQVCMLLIWFLFDIFYNIFTELLEKATKTTKCGHLVKLLCAIPRCQGVTT